MQGGSERPRRPVPLPALPRTQSPSQNVWRWHLGRDVAHPGALEPPCWPEDGVLLGAHDEVGVGRGGRQGLEPAGGQVERDSERSSCGDGCHLGAVLVCHYPRQLLARRCQRLRGRHWHLPALPYLGLQADPPQADACGARCVIVAVAYTNILVVPFQFSARRRSIRYRWLYSTFLPTASNTKANAKTSRQ